MKRNLPTLRDRDLAAEGLLLLEGSFLVERAISAGLIIRELICVQAQESRWRMTLDGIAAKGTAIAIDVMPEAGISDVAGYPFHRGVLALAGRPSFQKMDDWVGSSTRDALAGHLLCLWGVADQENLGTLVRSATSLGAAGIFLGPGCADPFGRKALRSSMGASLAMPLFRAPGDPEEACSILSGKGWLNVAASGGGKTVRDFLNARKSGNAEAKPVALWLGNEGFGLPDSLMAACAAVVAIPMSGKTDSLNVAAAGAILMWELFGE